MTLQMAATGNSPRRNQAATMPVNSAIIPGNGVGVAIIISGKVITAGYHVISMKNDFKTIYGDGVVKVDFSF